MKIIKEIIPFAIIILVVIIIRMFIITPVTVDGISMYPTLEDKDFLLLEKFDRNFKRFDIVVLDYNGERLVKRIIGLPGDNVEYMNDKLFINGKEVEETFLNKKYKKEKIKKLEKQNTEKVNFTADFNIQLIGYEVIPKNYYLVLGDNRPESADSRILGLINKKDINGKVIFNLFKFKTVK